MSLIYHIAGRDALAEARRNGEYRTVSLAQDGFIHFSGVHQVLDVANRFYGGQHGLLLLEVEAARLHSELKYEAPVHPAAVDAVPAGDELFPHLYGPLNADAIVAVYDFEPNAGGKFVLPADLIVKKDN